MWVCQLPLAEGKLQKAPYQSGLIRKSDWHLQRPLLGQLRLSLKFYFLLFKSPITSG